MSNFDVLKKLWAEKYRVPVVPGLNARERYVACLIVPQETDELAKIPHFQTPSDDDDALVGKYIQFRLSLWYGVDFIARLKQAPLDINPGVNTVSFVKAQDWWHFARASWAQTSCLFFPILSGEKQYPTLLELMNFELSGANKVRLEKFLKNGTV